MTEPPLFVFRRHGAAWRGRPVHPHGWLAFGLVLILPHLGWLTLLFNPRLSPWVPFAFAMLTLGPALWWLFRLARRRGLFID